MLLLFRSALASLLFAGCSMSTSPNGGSDPCTSPPTYAQVQAFEKCKHCHSSTLTSDAARNHAPPDINFDSYDAANMVASEAQLQVTQGRMPPASSGITLTDAEKTQLIAWVQCGTEK